MKKLFVIIIFSVAMFINFNSFAQRCTKCYGAKSFPCKKCDGNKRLDGCDNQKCVQGNSSYPCPSCKGESTPGCGRCGGSKIIWTTCRTCGGDSKHWCPICNGKDEYPCSRCGGTGNEP